MGCCKKNDQGSSTEALDVDVDERGKWANPAEFVLSCLGYAVGLGNVWRFPYLCYENGGGAFLIPYAIMLTFVGLPVFFIELSVGQYVGGGPMTVWAASPLFLGVGAGMIIISFIGSIYYNMIIAWSMYYMVAAWQKVLPWDGCFNDYNTAYCYSRREETDKCTKIHPNATWFNQTCYNASYIASFDEPSVTCNISGYNNDTCIPNVVRDWLKNETSKRVSASEEYFNYGMLNRLPTIEENGEMQWKLVLALLGAWILCYVCVIRGIKSSGKVVYFTATFPYLLLIILLIRGALLEGSLEGIKFYIIPEWEKLATPKVWVDAAGQIFFSLSVGMGGLMTFASYNKFHNNVYRDTMIVCIGNCLTSFFAGFAIFSIMGYLGVILDRPVDEVAKSGSGLAFVAYPEVVLYLKPPQLWATLFFFMLITLGLDSQFAGIENIMTAIVDLFPKLRRQKHWVALILCLVMFIVGLTMCTQAGIYWTELMSYYSSGWSLVLIGTCEAIIFAWVYKAKRLKKDIEYMVGFKLYNHWWVCWTIISPILLLAILAFNIYDTTPLSYGDYVLPQWAQTLGWLMAVASVAMVPIFAVIQIIRSYRWDDYKGLSFGQRICKLTKPNEDWIPSKERDERARQARLGLQGTAENGMTELPPPYSTNGKANLAYVSDSSDPSYMNGQTKAGYEGTEENRFTNLYEQPDMSNVVESTHL